MRNIIIIFLVICSIIGLTTNSILEGVESISKLKAKRAFDQAQEMGYETGYFETGAPASQMTQAELDHIDYVKNIDNYDVEYHESAEVLAKKEKNGLPPDVSWVFDPSLNKVIAVNRPAIQNNPTYYEPGIFKFGPSSYIPNYVESILLSNSNEYLVDK